MSNSTEALIATALSLSEADRYVLMNAIQESLLEPHLDHGMQPSTDQVAVTWQEEIATRMEEVRNGQQRTVSAEEAERMIRSDDELNF